MSGGGRVSSAVHTGSIGAMQTIVTNASSVCSPSPEIADACASSSGWIDRTSASYDPVLMWVGFAFAVLQQRRSELCTVAATLAEPLARVGYPAYMDKTLASHTPQDVRRLVEGAVGDIARRFKNLHHNLQH